MEDNEKKVVEENKDEIVEEKIEENNNKEESLSLEETKEVVDAEVVEDAKEEEKVEPMESIVEVDTTYDYKTLKYCNMYVIRVKRKSRLIYSIMAGICFVIGILCFIFMEGLNRYLSLIIVALGIWTVVSVFTEEGKIDKSLETYFKTHAPFKQHFAFNREKIRVFANVDGEEKSGDYPWAYIQEIHAIPEYFFLFLNGGTPIVIDRNPDKITKGTVEDLEQIIKEQTALKPFNQYDGKLVKTLKDIKYYEPDQSTAEVVENEKVEEKETEENKDSKEE